MIQGNKKSSRNELLIDEQVIDFIHGQTRHVAILQQTCHVVLAHPLGPGVDLGDDLRGVRPAVLAIRQLLVRGPFRVSHGLHESQPRPIRGSGTGKTGDVSVAASPALPHPNALVPGATLVNHALVRVRSKVHPQAVQERLLLGDINLPPAGAGSPPGHGHHRRRRRLNSRNEVAEMSAGHDGWQRQRVDRSWYVVPNTAERRHNDLAVGLVASNSGQAERRDRRTDQPRVHVTEIVPEQAPALKFCVRPTGN